MSAIHVFEYIGGLIIFGIGYWLLNGIIEEFYSLSETFSPFTFAKYAWVGVIIIYLIVGGFWLIRKYNEEAYY